MSIRSHAAVAPRPHASRLLAVLAVAVLVAACGGSSPSASPAAGTASPTPAPTATTGVGSTTPPSAGTAPSPSTSAASGALALQGRFIAVVKEVSPSVVVIETQTGLGSGIVFDAKGDIVTNAHVVGSSTQFVVTLADGRQMDGSLVGVFPQDDLAVVKVNGSGLVPATFADSSKLVVGDIVMAIGNPLGLQSSVTEGIVSAVGRTVSEPNSVALPNVIQTSAAINPGNSGGALVDLSGEVVGIPTLAAVDQQIGGSAPGIGFAIPSDTAKDIADQLIQYGHVVNSHRAYLGIQAANVLSGAGVLVYQVQAGGPAAKAGITTNELITAVDGQSTPSVAALSTVLAGLKPGATVPVKLLHADGTTSTVQVTLGELPG